MRLTKLLLVGACCSLATTACEPAQPAHKKHYGTLYHSSTDGHYYARSYDDSTQQFIFWMLIWPNLTSSSSPMINVGPMSGASWAQVAKAPADLSSTSKVVAEENGKPTEEVEEQSEVPEADVVDETTTESEAEAAEPEAAGSEGSSESTDSGTTSEGSGDSSGDSGGGDAGGDAGGGSD
jgi:uncharacterized membrane protein YgcG